MGIQIPLNVEQAAWYIERDGARFVEYRGGRYHYAGTVLGGTFTFSVTESEKADLDVARDRVAARIRAAFIKANS